MDRRSRRRHRAEQQPGTRNKTRHGEIHRNNCPQLNYGVAVFTFRPPSTDDVEWITAACQDADILRFTEVPRPYTTDHAQSFVNDWAGELRVWTIRDAHTDEGLGVVGVHHVRETIATVGYWVAPWGRRRGAARTALQFVCEELSTWPDVSLVRASIASTNEASQRVARRAGFAESTIEHDSRCPDGEVSVTAMVFERSLHS